VYVIATLQRRDTDKKKDCEGNQQKNEGIGFCGEWGLHFRLRYRVYEIKPREEKREDRNRENKLRKED